MSKAPPFPTEVVIGLLRYPIVLDPTLENEEKRGELVHNPSAERRVRINPTMPVSERAELLVHELLHGAFSMAGAEWLESGTTFGEAQEWFAFVAARGLSVILAANPGVREWLAWAWSRPV